MKRLASLLLASTLASSLFTPIATPASADAVVITKCGLITPPLALSPQLPVPQYQTAGGGSCVKVDATSLATYEVGASSGFYATPTDMFGICGSPTNTVWVLSLGVSLQSTAAAAFGISFIRRSSADTGGTVTNPTGIGYDSRDTAPTATLQVYTAAPTLGTTAGTWRYLPTPTTALTGAGGMANGVAQSTAVGSPAAPVGVEAERPFALHGPTECAYVNGNGTALPSGFVAAWNIRWVEFAPPSGTP